MANEIANRVEACAWIAAAAPVNSEGPQPVVADNFFFRSLSGFEDRIDVLSPPLGTEWSGLPTLTLGLYLERNYSRRATALFLQSIDTISVDPDSGGPSPIGMSTAPRVLPLTEAAYDRFFIDGGADPTINDLDPFKRLVIIIDLANFQVFGHGTEFSIEVLSMPRNDDGNTNVQFPVPPP